MEDAVFTCTMCEGKIVEYKPPSCVRLCVVEIVSLRYCLILCYQGILSIVDSCSKLFKFKKVITISVGLTCSVKQKSKSKM